MLNINRNNEYSIDSNNRRKSGKKIDLTLIFLQKKQKKNGRKNEASINDYSFVKKKNCLDIDCIYKNKYGIKLSKSNDNIYHSNNNT